MSDAVNAEVSETLHGWLCHWQRAYPEIVVIECTCGHTSVRDRDQVAQHACPGCGRTVLHVDTDGASVVAARAAEIAARIRAPTRAPLALASLLTMMGPQIEPYAEPPQPAPVSRRRARKDRKLARITGKKSK